jgi:hypothetical protein
MLNPFINRTEIKMTKKEILKTILMTLTGISIIRFILVFVFIFLMLFTLFITTIGYYSNDEQLDRCSKIIFYINKFISNIKYCFCKKNTNTTKFHEMSCFRRCLLYCVQFYARCILFVLGYYWIPETYPIQTLNKKIFLFPSYLERPGSAKICVANHVSLIDSLYFMSRCIPRSVVIQANMAKPVSWLMHAFSPIIVPVTSEQRKLYKSPQEQITENLESTILTRPMIIFPEGGTTQSNTLIKFQNGAFTNLQEIQPIAFKYNYYNFDPSWTNDVKPLWLLFRMCCQFINFMSVEYYDIINPINSIINNDIEQPSESKDASYTHGQIENFRSIVYSKYTSDPYFISTPYSLSDSRLTSKLNFQKKIPINFVCNVVLQDGKLTVTNICNTYKITREELEKIIIKYYKIVKDSDKLSFEQFKLLVNKHNYTNLENIYNYIKNGKEYITFFDILLTLQKIYIDINKENIQSEPNKSDTVIGNNLDEININVDSYTVDMFSDTTNKQKNIHTYFVSVLTT